MTSMLPALKAALPPSEFAALEAWLSTFYAFQRRWALEPSRFAICNKARQIGYSHSTAAWAVIRAAFLGETVTIISKGERESLEVLDKAARHAGVLTALGSRWSAAKPRGEELRFVSGGRLLALPASSGGRSFSGHVVLDEFAYHEGKSERVWDSAAAVVMHGHCLRVVSTPNGVGNLFHTLWTDPVSSAGYAKHETTITQAIADGMRVNVGECWKMAHGDVRLFAQLFECSFLDSAEQYIPTAAIENAVEDVWQPPAGLTYAGLDIGMTNDASSLQVVRQGPDKIIWRVDAVEWKRTDWEAQERGIAASYAKHRWSRLYVDKTGIGAVPAQRLVARYGAQRVVPIDFSLQSKETLVTRLYQVFCDELIRIPRDSALVDDLCALRRMVTSTGAIRYDAPRTSRGHADRAWALALALQACAVPQIRRALAPGLVA